MQSYLEPTHLEHAGAAETGGRRKVLFVSVSLSNGGAERFVSTLLCHLNRDRFTPQLCVFRDNITYDLPDDVPVTILEKYNPWQIPRTIRRLRQTIAATCPDVVISNMTFTNWMTGAALLGCPHRPCWLARFGANPYQNYGIMFRWFLRPIVRRLLGQADACVANSRGLCQLVRRYFGFDESRVELAYNPVDIQLLRSLAACGTNRQNQSAQPVIVWVGRLVSEKRPELLLDAFALVRRQMPARLRIFGDGPLRQDLERRINLLGLSGQVELMGFQLNPFAFAHEASAFVLTSNYEGMPNALIEAQALGLPAVSTNCDTGPAEIIEDGETGYLVPVGDARAIADRLVALLCNDERRAEMSERAKERAARLFGIDKVLPQWESTILRRPEEAVECVG